MCGWVWVRAIDVSSCLLFHVAMDARLAMVYGSIS